MRNLQNEEKFGPHGMEADRGARPWARLPRVAGMLAAGALALTLCACGGAEDTQVGYASEEEVDGERPAGEEKEAAGEQSAAAADAPKDFSAPEGKTLLDASRIQADKLDQGHLFDEFTVPYDREGEMDASRTYTFRTDGTYALGSYWTGKMEGVGELSLLYLPTYAEWDEESSLVSNIMVSLNDSFSGEDEFLGICGEEDSIEQLEDSLYYWPNVEEGFIKMIKIVSGQTVELTYGVYGNEVDAEEIKTHMMGIAGCITSDTGAPLIHDLACLKDFGGFSIKDASTFNSIGAGFYDEGKKQVFYDVDVYDRVDKADDADLLSVNIKSLGFEFYGDGLYDEMESKVELFGNEFHFTQDPYCNMITDEDEVYYSFEVDSSLEESASPELFKQLVEKYLQYN